jgi:hypothetical protein
MPRAILSLCVAVLIAGCRLHGAVAPPTPVPHKLGYTSGQGWFVYFSGTAGTVTVPSGSYVTGLSCHATGSGASLTITPDGPNIPTPTAGSAIPIPAGAAYSLSRPVIAGNANELGAGSVFVFAGTDAYIVTTYVIGGP